MPLPSRQTPSVSGIRSADLIEAGSRPRGACRRQAMSAVCKLAALLVAECRSVRVFQGVGESAPRRKPTASASAPAPRSELPFPGMASSPGPTAETVLVSGHAAEQYQQRVKPGLDLDAARGELERLRAVGEISVRAPGWLNAAKPAPYYLLIGDAVVLPVLPQGEGWVATTCVTQRTLTPTRRDAKAAHKASLGARKRAARRARF